MPGDPRVRAGVEWRRVDGRVVAMDVETGDCVALNRTGAALWEAVVGGADAERLARVLVERFDVAEATARADVDSFLGALRARGLLEE